MKSILFIYPDASEYSPVTKRTEAFIKFTEDYQYTVYKFKDIIGWWRKLYYLIKADNIFITMPPFRYWFIIILFSYKTVVDWRDGWSIAMKSGYGGTARPNLLKSILARVIELLTIFMCKKVVTCTPGLLNYHTKSLPRTLKSKIILITNGHNLNVKAGDFQNLNFVEKSKLKLVCVGKFAEYGFDKASKAIETCFSRYPNAFIDLTIIGGNLEINKLFFSKLHLPTRFKYSLLGSVSYNKAIDILKNNDIAIAIIRDTEYDLGTKAFDYVACGIPILDIFNENCNFKVYFKYCFDSDYCQETAYKKALMFSREKVCSKLSLVYI